MEGRKEIMKGRKRTRWKKEEGNYGKKKVRGVRRKE